MENEKEPDDIDLEQEPIMGTAEFKALTELKDEPLNDDSGSLETEDDALTITDKLKTLNVDDTDNVFDLDPYDIE